jgi:DNA transformation protein
MFALADDDVIYIKSDAAFQAELAEQGSAAWEYSMKREGSTRSMGYWRLPETAADDPDEAVALARRAFACALKAKAAKPAAKKKPPAKPAAKK